MSPWWRESVVARLTPRELRVARWSRGLRRTCRDSAVVPVTPAASQEPWRAGVDALALLLQDKRFRGAPVTVEVSGPFARWLLLPPSPALATDDEWLAYARLEFAAVHGERTREWDLRLGEQMPRQPVPACALDARLIAELRAACERAGRPLAAVTPTFSALYDTHRTALRGPVAALAHLDAGRLTVALFARGAWRGLSDVRMAQAPVAALEAELAQLAALGPLPESPRRLCVVDESGAERLPPRLGDWDVVTRLQRPAKAAPAATALRAGGRA